MKITVNVNTEYDVLIEKGLIYQCGEHIEKYAKGKNIVLISDRLVFHLYGTAVVGQLENAGYTVSIYLITPGEGSKDLKTVNDIVAYMSSKYICTNDTVVALGGGVVGDIAGFVASVYKRGIACIHIPTSLIAQIDSSIGGKTGINMGLYKNTIGTIYHPKMVLVDPLALSTLSPRQYYNGVSEAIKCACIKDNSFFQQVKNGDCDTESMINRSILIKKELVEQDQFDKGVRRLLNFGHTIGHAIELNCAKYRYSFLHGEAVAIGMCKITEITEEMGLTRSGTALQLRVLLARNNLPTDYPELLERDIKKCIYNDKKAQQDKINIAYLKDIGNADITEIDIKTLTDMV